MSLLQQLQEDIPPIQRLLLFDQSLLANFDESSTLAELSQHILYYRDARTNNDHHPEDKDSTNTTPPPLCHYAMEPIIQFSSLCLTLLALPKELTPGSERSRIENEHDDEEDEPPPDPGGMVYLNTCTLIFLSLERLEPANPTLMAVVQLPRLPGVRDNDASLFAKLGTRQLVHGVLERIHALWQILYGGGVRVRLENLWKRWAEQQQQQQDPTILGRRSSWQECPEWDILKKEIKIHYDEYLEECFVKGRGAGREGTKEMRRWGEKRTTRVSLPLLALQAQKMRLEERSPPLKLPNLLKPYLVGNVEPDSLDFPFPRECKGLSCFYQGRHVHSKLFHGNPSSPLSSTPTMLEEEQMMVLLDYFTLCDEGNAKRSKQWRGNYFIPYPSESTIGSTDHRCHYQALNHEYTWEGSLRLVHAPRVSLRIQSVCIQTYYATLLVRGEFGFLFLLQGEEQDWNVGSGETGATDTHNSMQERFGECSKLLHEFMSNM